MATCDMQLNWVQIANTPRVSGPQRVLTNPTCKEVVMASNRVCAIDRCCKPVIARGYCTLHYQRWKKTGDACADVAPRGAARDWLYEIANAKHDNKCLMYPFFRRPDGYGQYQESGRKVLAHRKVCQLAHGDPSGSDHEVAHSCGKGHLGCVNPRHLRWDSREGNMSDKVQHGTHARGERSCNAKLCEADVREIRRLAGVISYRQIGERFGIAKNTARLIAIGERWGWLE